MEKQKNIPELRFPGFDGEWKRMCVGDISKKVGSGSTPLGGSKTYQAEGIIFIRSQNVNSDILNLEDVVFISEQTNDKMSGSKVLAEDILLNITGASIGRSCVVPKDFQIGNVNQHVCIIRLRQDYSPYFFQPFLSSDRGQKLVFQEQAGGGREGLNFQSIRRFKTHFPSLPEQQKIASFFTAINQKISQLKQKKTLLEQYKKGVMQKIFSQQLRFRDDNGQEFPKWEEKKFNEAYSFKTTNSFSRDNLNYESGDVKNIHYGDIHTKYPTLLDITQHDVPYVNPDISIKKIKEDSYCINNDLIFADASEDVPDVGKCIELVNINGEKVLAGLHTILARPDIKKVAGGFGGYLMASNGIRKQIMKISQGSKVTSISSTRLGEIEIELPCPGEQTKIANFLSAIDTKINHTQTQIEKAERWKKGLLQKMFV
jgi:type I restriction enzyme, S subunit